MEVTAQTDEKYMRLALNEARDAFNQGEVPIGAVIVSGGAIVGRGHNLVETLTDVTAHAEIQALTAASATLGGKYLPDCTLYVTVEPCVMCAGALAWSQIGRIVYGASDPKRGYTRIGNAMLHPDTRTTTDCKCHTATNTSPYAATGTATDTSPCVATDTTPPARGASDEAADKLLLHPKTRVTAGVLAAECEALMSEFFMKLRR